MRTPLLVLLLVASVLLASVTGAATPSQAAPGPLAGSSERRMFELLNVERIAQGLTPVVWSPELAQAAALHSADMAAKGYLDHDAPDGSDPPARAARAGYLVPPGTGWLVIEAISARPSLDAALSWLLTDGVHPRVLLRSVWREVGIGYTAGGAYGNYWVLDFGCRPNVLPVFAEPATDGRSVQLTFTNESCASAGGSAQQMGRATELMVSPRADFEGGEWEPFVATKQLPRPTANELSVRLRDASGRLSAPAHLSLADLPAGSSLRPEPTATATVSPTRQPTATPLPPTPTATVEPTATLAPSPTATTEPDE
jgi:uncharacterized protein YkwD